MITISYFSWVLIVVFAVLCVGLIFIATTSVKSWISSLSAILLSAIGFSWLDNWFVVQGCLIYNSDLVSASHFGEVPIESIAYYFIMPFLSLFFYRFTKNLFSKKIKIQFANYVTAGFIIIILALILAFNAKTYTMIVGAMAVVFLLIQLILVRGKYMKYFWISFVIQLIPFFIVEGIIAHKSIIQFYSSGNSGIHIFSIPIERVIMNLNIYLLPVMITESFKKPKK